MANYNLTNQDIKDTFQQLAQVSGSIEGGVSGSGITDGTGSRVTNLHVTASNALDAISSSYALTASFAQNVPTIDTGSFLITASNIDATITYTQADGSTFVNVINNVANADEAKDTINPDTDNISKYLSKHSNIEKLHQLLNKTNSLWNLFSRETNLRKDYQLNSLFVDWERDLGISKKI